MMELKDYEKRMTDNGQWSMLSTETLLSLAEEGCLSAEAGQELALRHIKLMLPTDNKENRKVKFMGRQLETFVNDYNCPTKELAEYMASNMVHRTLQQTFFGFVMKCVKAFSEVPDKCQDPRNEAACKTARTLMELIRKNDVPTDFPLI